jgi:type IV secretory pathway VirB10-like protein
MKQVPIQKLNKKLIYLCLLIVVAIAIPLAILPMASSAKASEVIKEKLPVQAQVQAEDAYAISGMEKFPASYEGLKQFEDEKAINQKAVHEKDVALAFDKLASIDQEQPQIASSPNAEDPWAEAYKQEQKHQAFDHYNAKRSSIQFARNNAAEKKDFQNEKDPMVGMLERTLDLAQKTMTPGYTQANDVFFKRHDLNSKAEDIGRLKRAPPFTLSEGTLIPAILLSEINTDLPGPILARVSHNIWDSKTGQALLIPQNSTIIGEYQSRVGHGQSRAQVVWSRIIFPNQQSVNLGEMVGLDKRGVSGASGSVNNHYDKVGLGLLMTTALGGGVRMTQGKYDQNSASMTQEFGNSLAQETMRLGTKIADKMLAIPPTMVVPTGKRLNVFVEQDLHLQPYHG